MALATPLKTKRNLRIIRLKDKENMSFPAIGKRFDISDDRVKEIYYRHKKRPQSILGALERGYSLETVAVIFHLPLKEVRRAYREGLKQRKAEKK